VLDCAGNGNVNPGVEFNMKADPEAALVVFDAVSRPVYVLPWETVIDSELPLVSPEE
jgi:inosine-uridine nucleoside N-ribohydrolase